MTRTGKSASRAPAGPARAPIHELVYQKLRAQILFGELAPGQQVTIQGLTEAIGAGMTPVREAIRRLISDGALLFQGNRRVSVPTLSAADVEQLVFIRKTIEWELTYRAADRISDAALAQLAEIDTALDSAISSGDVKRYLSGNYRFHALLYQQAEAPIMADLVDRLWLRFGPSLRVVCGRFGTQNLPDRHKQVLRALQAKQARAAGDALVLDIEQGMQQIMAVLGAQSDSIDRE